MSRIDLIIKYKRNSELIEDFKILFENYLNKTNSWEKRTFPDSNITNREYLITLTQVSEQEYSIKQYDSIKTAYIHEEAIRDYISNLDIQYDNLKILHDEIKQKEQK